MAKYVGTKRLGSLNYAGQTLAPATRPWLTDLSVLCPYDGLMPGNIPEFERDPDWDKWSIGNSPQDRSLCINWHVFQQNGGCILVADRMLMSRISWQDLDDAGYVHGTDVIIDNKRYICRLMTGGHSSRENPYDGATTANEWDNLVGGFGVQNTSKIDFPLDNCELSPKHLNSSHNKKWNWFGAVSWTAEPTANRIDGRVCRGYHGPTFFYVNTVDHRHEDIGWRPILEEQK